MRNGYPSLSLCLKRLRSLVGALLLALGALGVEAQAAPKISSISPESGTATTRVTITGKSFGSNQGGSRVTFGGLEASRYYQWSETRIQVRPPAGLAAGTYAVVVRVGNQASGGVDYTVLAKLTAFCLAPGQTIAEPEGSFEMGVHRSGPTSSALTVTVTYSGTATHGSDYRAPESLTIGAGERRASARLQVIDDAVEEGEERIKYQVSADGYRPGSCRVTLEDNDTGAPPGPEISGLNPASGAVGTSVTIMGANFGAGGSVTFAGTGANTTGWSGTSITATVPEGATTGDVVVTVGGVASNGVGFTVRAPGPEISGLNPASGAVGTPVEIRGTNFGVSEGTSTVEFAGTEAEPSSWSETRITARVPEGATSGAVVVTVEGVASNGVGFTVTVPAPEISGLNPASGAVGTSVEIRGTNFGVSEGTSTVEFAGTEAEPSSWSETRITARVPEGARTGAVVVTVDGVASNGVGFTVGEAEDRPMRLLCASSVSEPSGSARYIFAYVGSGNEPAEDLTVTLAYSGTATHETDYTSPETLTIPAGRASGTMSPRLAVVDDRVYEGEETIELTATAAGYEAATCTITLEDDETVPVPAISGLNPAAGPVGTSVTITGSNFGENRGTSRVSFAGTEAEPSSWSDTSIVAPVPAGARTGAVVVTVGSEASAGVPFRVTGVRVSPTELTIEEGGEGSYTVVLDSEPASAVTVSMFAPAGTDLSVDILPVFTASNWNRPQTVTVTAGEDEDQEDERVTLTHRTASADAGYHDLTVDSLEVTITDNDAGAGVRVSPTELTIEEGGEGIYTVVLNTEPAAGVTVTVEAGGDLTADPAVLAFTALNWDRPQEVRVTAGEDEDAADETESITHGVTTVDSGYVGVVVDEVRVTIADDEGAGGPGVGEELTVSTTRLRITEGNMGSYTVVLNREPASGVAVAVSAGGDLTVDPAVLAFTAADWDTPQEVMVTAGEDADLADEVESITHTITRTSSTSGSAVRGGAGRQAAFALAAAGPAPTREYVYLGGRLVAIEAGGVVSEASVVVTIDDDDDPDTPGVPALTNSLRLTEGHTGAYTLELGAAPTAPVTITLTVSRGSDNVADVTVNPTALTFTASDWDAPQWVTVSVAEDSDTVGETETITHAASSTDSRYEGIEITPVSVVIRDRNPTRTPTGTLTANPDPCTIAAGATTCSTTLTWTSTNTTAVQVRRIRPQAGSTPSINEIVVRSGSPNGDTTFSRIDLTDSPFYLYDYSDGRRGRELDTVTVHGVGALSIDPTSGPVGTSVTIMGSGFGTIQGTVTFGGIAAGITSWSDTRVVVEVPAGLTSGALSVVLTVGGQPITVGTFTVTTPPGPGPTITSLSPDSGIVTRWVTITGMGFGASQGASTVTFNGTPVSSGGIISWSDTVIEARVPAGASSGPVVVTVGENMSNGFPFTVRPTLTCQAWPYDIKVGASSTLSWTTVGASSLTIDDGDAQTAPITVASTDIAAGSRMVTPPATTDYSLKATAADGQAAYCTGRVTLWEAPVIEVFRADPEDINEGEVTRLSWGTTHTTSVEIDQGIGSVSVVDGGYVDVAPARTTPYTLMATNRAWEGSDGVTAEVEVRVAPNPGGPTITCSPASSDLFRGNSETLEWTTTGATSLTIDDGDGNTIFTAGAKEVARGMHSVIPDKPTTYRLTATDSNNRSSTCPSTLTPWDAPVISLTATPSVIARGESSTLKWHVANATEVTFGYGYRDPRTGEIRYVEPRAPRYVFLSGTRVVTPGETSGYTLEATNPKYDILNAVESHVEVTVTSGPPPITCSISPTDIKLVQPGASATLKWQTTGNISSVSIRPDPGGGTPGTSGSRMVTPPGTTTYRFTATDQGGRSYKCAAGVTVWEQPVVSSFKANPDSIDSGEATTLDWSTRHATDVSIRPDPGGGTPGASGSRNVSPTTTTTYTLTASNPAWTDGDSTTARVPVTVSGVGDASCTLSASDSDIKPDESTTLSWTSRNADRLILNPGNIDVTNDADRSLAVTPGHGRSAPLHADRHRCGRERRLPGRGHRVGATERHA